MKTLEIYKNYGVLAAEKRNVYTYGREHAHAVCSDKLTVEIPEDFDVCESVTGDMLVETPWGGTYLVNDILKGDQAPCFSAYDKDGKLHTAKLKIVR